MAALSPATAGPGLPRYADAVALGGTDPRQPEPQRPAGITPGGQPWRPCQRGR